MSIPAVASMVAAGLFAVYFGLCVVTVGMAVRKQRADSRREQFRDRLRQELFERQQRDDPDWETWIVSLSTTERAVLTAVVERYLRLVTGSQEETLLEVADTLDLGSRADARLDESASVPRLSALTTLSMLSYPLSIERIEATCTDTQRVREAAARLLYERRDDYQTASERGTKLLLWDGGESLSIYGLETLSLLNSGAETPLFGLAEREADTWDRSVLVQVCRVLEETQTVDSSISFDWLVAVLDDPDPTVRAAAIRALTPHGWRDNLRERLDLDALTDDPAPRVRRAAYDLLAEWGDEAARGALLRAVCRERDSRCQLVAVQSLERLDIDPPMDDPTFPAVAWRWLQAERNSERGVG
jgi:hypothetical protein